MSTVDCETNSCAGLFLGCAEEELSETDSTALNCFGERFQGSVTIAGMLKGVDFGLLDARIVEIRFKGHDFTSIGAPAFHDLPVTVKSLSFSDNQQLEAVAPDAFSNWTNLEHLSISRNPQLAQISSRAFSGLEKLLHLDLSSNNLAELNQDTLQDLTSLESLDLRSNVLESVHGPSLFQFFSAPVEPSRKGLVSLNSLFLQNNKIESIFFDLSLPSLDSVTHLDLSNNQLSLLVPRQFSKLPNIQILGLARNQLSTSSSPSSFSSLLSLRSLDLSSNAFLSIPSDMLAPVATSLNRLVLATNPFQTVPRLAFQTMASLKQLDLRNNFIDTLEEGAFTGLDKLEYLYLSNDEEVHSRGCRQQVKLGFPCAQTHFVHPLAFEGCCTAIHTFASFNSLLEQSSLFALPASEFGSELPIAASWSDPISCPPWSTATVQCALGESSHACQTTCVCVEGFTQTSFGCVATPTFQPSLEPTPHPIPIQGCTYRTANNFNPRAAGDDGSCSFPTAFSAQDLVLSSLSCAIAVGLLAAVCARRWLHHGAARRKHRNFHATHPTHPHRAKDTPISPAQHNKGESWRPDKPIHHNIPPASALSLPGLALEAKSQTTASAGTPSVSKKTEKATGRVETQAESGSGSTGATVAFDIPHGVRAQARSAEKQVRRLREAKGRSDIRGVWPGGRGDGQQQENAHGTNSFFHLSLADEEYSLLESIEEETQKRNKTADQSSDDEEAQKRPRKKSTPPARKRHRHNQKPRHHSQNMAQKKYGAKTNHGHGSEKTKSRTQKQKESKPRRKKSKHKKATQG